MKKLISSSYISFVKIKNMRFNRNIFIIKSRIITYTRKTEIIFISIFCFVKNKPVLWNYIIKRQFQIRGRIPQFMTTSKSEFNFFPSENSIFQAKIDRFQISVFNIFNYIPTAYFIIIIL